MLFLITTFFKKLTHTLPLIPTPPTKRKQNFLFKYVHSVCCSHPLCKVWLGGCRRISWNMFPYSILVSTIQNTFSPSSSIWFAFMCTCGTWHLSNFLSFFSGSLHVPYFSCHSFHDSLWLSTIVAVHAAYENCSIHV